MFGDQFAGNLRHSRFVGRPIGFFRSVFSQYGGVR
jgi:hypothetical protein